MNTRRLTRNFHRSKQRLVRSVERAARHQQRRVFRQLRRTQRALNVWQQRQYFLGRAWHDLRLAITRNEDIFIGCAIAGLVMVYAFATAASQLLFFSFQSLNALSDVTGFSMGTLTLIGLGVVTTLAAWFMVLITNSLNIAILDGAFHKAGTSLRHTAHQALSLTPRVSLAWLLTLVIGGGSLLLAALPFLLYIAAHRHTPLAPGFIMLAVAVLATVLYRVSSILLTPSVVLYEPQRSWHDTIARSFRLCKPRGRLSIVSLTILLAASLTVSWLLSVWLQQVLHYTGDIVFYLLAISELVFANLLLTMLYRKRKLTHRENKQSAHLFWRRISTGSPVNG